MTTIFWLYSCQFAQHADNTFHNPYNTVSLTDFMLCHFPQMLVVGTATPACWTGAAPTKTHSCWPKCSAAVIAGAAGPMDPLLKCVQFVEQVGSLTITWHWIFLCVCVSTQRTSFLLFFTCTHFRRVPETVHPDTWWELSNSISWSTPCARSWSYSHPGSSPRPTSDSNTTPDPTNPRTLSRTPYPTSSTRYDPAFSCCLIHIHTPCLESWRVP